MANPVAYKPRDLDAILEAFELASERAGGAEVVDYLPDASDPSYHRIAVELIRVDLERSWARGHKKRLDVYRQVTPQLFEHPGRLKEIAFEEYRLRKQAGERVTTAEYSERYAIDTSAWPHDDADVEPSIVRFSPVNGSAVGHNIRVPVFPRAGEMFGGFELVEELGRGAFGVVFRARQADLAARDVVLKITALRSVEPQRLARLQHTNIVPLYSMHEHAGLLAICMPFFGRQTLADFTRGRTTGAEQAEISTVVERDIPTIPIRPADAASQLPSDPQPSTLDPRPSPSGPQPSTLNPQPLATIVDRIAQLAEALAHAHSRNIVHSDLKPANVLITDDGVPMLLDFNLSSDTSSPYQKATLLVGGTLPYMAPEHLLATLDGSAVPEASDVFSLGVIAFELLTGRRPFADRPGDFDQTVDQLVADRQRLAPTVRSLNPQVSEGLSAIIAKCLAPEHRERYATAAQLAEDLRCYQRDLPLRHAPETSLRERGSKWLRRNARGVRWAIAASLIGLTAITSAMFIARQHRLSILETTAAFNDFEHDAQVALANLYAPGGEPELRSLGAEAAERALARLGILPGDPQSNNKLAQLSPEQRTSAERQAIDMLYALAAQALFNEDAANGAEATQRAERGLRYNDAALALLPAPTSSQALLLQRAAILKAAGDEAHAAQAADRAKQAAAGAQDKFLSAVALFDDRHYAEAVKAAEQTCRENPQDPLRQLLLGNSYFGAGQLTKAEGAYTALIALQPKTVSGYLYRGLCRTEQGDLAGAEEDYTQALIVNPALATTRINRALTYYALGNFVAAEKDASAAIASGLADPRAYFVRALIRDTLGKHAEAQADRDEGFKRPPLDDKGWVARGMAVLKSDPARAAHEFEQGIAKYPSSKPLLQNLVHVYADRLNRLTDALAIADRRIALSPHDSAALASRAVLHARTGDVEAAKKDGAQATANQPTPLTSLQLACAYALLAPAHPAEANDAIHHLQLALARDPKLALRAAADTDLAALHDNVEFQALIASATKLVSPPTSSTQPSSKPTEQSSERAAGNGAKQPKS